MIYELTKVLTTLSSLVNIDEQKRKKQQKSRRNSAFLIAFLHISCIIKSGKFLEEWI